MAHSSASAWWIFKEFSVGGQSVIGDDKAVFLAGLAIKNLLMAVGLFCFEPGHEASGIAMRCLKCHDWKDSMRMVFCCSGKEALCND